MKHLFVSLWVGVVVYTGISFYAGPSGVIATRSLMSERDRLSKNLENLTTINQQLGSTLDALRYDPDTIAAYARELGYGTAQEHFVRVEGEPLLVKRSYMAGNLVIPVTPATLSHQSILLIAVSISMTLWLLLTIADHRKK